MQKLRPFLKAITPAVLTVIAVLVDWLILGKFEKQTLAIAITGLVSAVITYLVPNTPKTVLPTGGIGHAQDITAHPTTGSDGT